MVTYFNFCMFVEFNNITYFATKTFAKHRRASVASTDREIFNSIAEGRTSSTDVTNK